MQDEGLEKGGIFLWQGFVMKLIVFGMISTVVLNIMPREVYKKYIRLVMGFLLILIIIEPVASLLGAKEDMINIFKTNFSKVLELEAIPDYEDANAVYQELLQGLYENEVKEMGEEPWKTEESGDEDPKKAEESGNKDS